MKEVKSPKKPLLYYYGIVLLILVIFNVVITPMFAKSMVREVDYGTFMTKIEQKKIENVGKRNEVGCGDGLRQRTSRVGT